MDPEPDGNIFVFTVILVLLMILSALYAAGESALVNLGSSSVKKDAENGNKKAERLLRTISAQSFPISPMQSGLTVCGFFGLASAICAYSGLLDSAFSAIESGLIRNLAVFSVITAVYLPLYLILFNLLPRRMAQRNAEEFAYKYVGMISMLSLLARPFLSLCILFSNGLLRLMRVDPNSIDDNVTEEEILQMVGEGEESGVIEVSEKDMIRNIFDFNDTTVGEVMTHRTDIIAVSDEEGIPDAITASVENGCSRIPVYHDDIDSVLGICYIKDLLPYVVTELPDFIKITDVMRPPYFIPESKKCSQLFTEMTERKVQIAIVVDEYGGTAGLITLEDLIESIVGNIQDEYDHEEEEIQQVSDTEFTVDGSTSISEISELIGVDLPESDYDTIAGLVTEQLGRIPKEDEHPTVDIGRLSITVLEIEDQRLAKLHILKNPPKDEDDENDGKDSEKE